MRTPSDATRSICAHSSAVDGTEPSQAWPRVLDRTRHLRPVVDQQPRARTSCQRLELRQIQMHAERTIGELGHAARGLARRGCVRHDCRRRDPPLRHELECRVVHLLADPEIVGNAIIGPQASAASYGRPSPRTAKAERLRHAERSSRLQFARLTIVDLSAITALISSRTSSATRSHERDLPCAEIAAWSQAHASTSRNPSASASHRRPAR